MQILMRAVLGQILTVVANILMVCLLAALAMVISPFTTKYSFYLHLANQPLLEQLRMAFNSFTKRRYMIGQTGRKPLGSCLGMFLIALFGLITVFISTAVYQTSHTELRNTSNGAARLISTDNMPTRNKYGDNGNVKYPVISDQFLGSNTTSTFANGFPQDVMTTEFWNNDIAHSTQTKSEFSGNVSVSLSDLNWLSIKGSDGVTTTVLMSLDGITAESLPNSTPGTLSVQLLDNGLPALFDVPVVSQSTGNKYAFAVAGVYTLDYVQFDLLKFESKVWTNGENLESYYEFLAEQAPFTNENGTDLFNHTYDYSNKNTYDKSDLESDLQKTGDNTVKYSLIGMRNLTKETDLFQSYALTKRSVYRESSITSANNTINLVEMHYQVQITKYSKPAQLQDEFKVRYTAGTHSDGGAALPVTPVFTTLQSDFVNMASLTGNDKIADLFTPETYIDIFPTIIVIIVYGAVTFLATIIALAWNFKRYANKAYSFPLELINFLLYNPGMALMPVFQKVRRAKLSMVDGYDPSAGYNHLGLVDPEDALRITRDEPDVPYGLIYKTPTSMLDAGAYPGYA
ncbi:hypothetical protein DV495_003788 [Geotrichum candidum]|uniref:Uncharacterized protein n=1 Tax=Geotrichum candidum TaxID=1173061 RepID=A0A0J9X887_GEOCN|nr:hypothetical protein DV454_004947 [Geotrichum candidum]KAI9211221.1 hypothetical protein DS838_003897 [Geotrichum bryndzae]KAF5113212.1 hypothetical protein DV452_003739 [Geotrichum candidum]KAF5124788.1 hypothetical protein DV495_003788 [Geotrichum candidum]KAF7497789.1 hypothetical protein DV113_004186 [Geotrichum candidum]